VKGGTFEIGPLKREVTTTDVCMDATEVTAATYEACVKAGKCSDFQLECADAATYRAPGKERLPVVCVDYPQAKAVCAWRGMRLPTESEWEWAARGGEENRRYAWGDEDPRDQACWSGSSAGVRKGPCEIGSHEAGKSKDGLHDMTGNVFEWTSTSADGTDRMFVVRGGSWRDGVKNLLWNGRPGGFKPSYRCGFGGVRCVVEPRSGGTPQVRPGAAAPAGGAATPGAPAP
jgi:formylglycine-generating enzyme required for sulfatase activity